MSVTIFQNNSGIAQGFFDVSPGGILSVISISDFSERSAGASNYRAIVRERERFENKGQRFLRLKFREEMDGEKIQTIPHGNIIPGISGCPANQFNQRWNDSLSATPCPNNRVHRKLMVNVLEMDKNTPYFLHVSCEATRKVWTKKRRGISYRPNRFSTHRITQPMTGTNWVPRPFY